MSRPLQEYHTRWQRVVPEPQEQNQRRRSKLTNDELRARLTAATQALDSLLEEFVQQGYQAEMSKRLQELVN